jgi:hypothetical protein
MDSCAIPKPSRRFRLALYGKSLQVAVSPCWELALPDVISANLSPDAWIHTPAAPVVHLLVSSHRASAFPTYTQGRRSAYIRTVTSVRHEFRGCNHSLIFRPLGLLAIQVTPTTAYIDAGQPSLLLPRISQFVTSLCSGYANRPNRAIDGMRTFTSLDSQHCRLLRVRFV